jgi:hypothetical protein
MHLSSTVSLLLIGRQNGKDMSYVNQRRRERLNPPSVEGSEIAHTLEVLIAGHRHRY